MSQESISTKELGMEIQECQDSHSRLMDYSNSVNPLIIQDSEIQSQNEPWSSEEIDILETNIIFYKRMITQIQCAKSLGPVNLPKAPKRKVQDLFKEKLRKKRKQTTTTPEELHTFLKSRKVDLSRTILRRKFVFNLQSGEEDIVTQLQEAHKHLGRHNAQGMLFNITFGNFLNDVREWFLKEKESKLFSTTWDTWLSSKIAISIPHARKLRQLSNLLKGFNGFLNINVSINDILSKQKLIKQMLAIDEFATFWGQIDNIPTDELTQSQEV